MSRGAPCRGPEAPGEAVLGRWQVRIGEPTAISSAFGGALGWRGRENRSRRDLSRQQWEKQLLSTNSSSLERLCGRMQMPANARPLRNSASPRLEWSHLPPRNAGTFCSLRPTTGSRRKCLPEPCWDPGYCEPLSEADRKRTRVWGPPSWIALTSATSLELPLSAQNRTPSLRRAQGAGRAMLGRRKAGQCYLRLGTNPGQRLSPGNTMA